MELNYWGSTTAKSAQLRRGGGRVDASSSSATGAEITLRPKQLVLATGMSGKPNVPEIPGHGRLPGRPAPLLRSTPGPDAYAGKRCVVIGSNNSAHDICAALWEAGADVTMVQRSSTHIVRSDTLMDIGARRALLRGGGRDRRDDGEGRPDLRLAAVPDHARVPDPALRRRCASSDARLLRPPRGGRLPARLGRGRLRPVHEVPAPRLGLLHRRRRLRARRRRRDQARERAGRPPHRGRGRAEPTAPSCRPTSSSTRPATAR